MGHRFLEVTGTPAVKAEQTRLGSRNAYAGAEGGEDHHDALGPSEAAFIGARDSFYLASISESGWPYIQHRGGPAGFLKVLGPKTLAFADYRGNRQYITLGNVKGEDRVALFLMDYPNRARLKLLGRMNAVELAENPELAERVADPGYRARPEHTLVISVEAFDWNCPQHITPRFTEAEIATAVQPLRDRLAELEAENADLRARLGLV